MRRGVTGMPVVTLNPKAGSCPVCGAKPKQPCRYLAQTGLATRHLIGQPMLRFHSARYYTARRRMVAAARRARRVAGVLEED